MFRPLPKNLRPKCLTQGTLRTTLYISLLSTISLLTACSSFDLIPSDSLILRLKDRGPVLVSPDNPYLAANLLLDQESKSNPQLTGFITKRGLPTALTVSQGMFDPAEIILYYKDRNEQYNLELLQGIWVIKGPAAIKDKSALSLLQSIDPLPTEDRLPAEPKPIVAINDAPQKTEIASADTPSDNFSQLESFDLPEETSKGLSIAKPRTGALDKLDREKAKVYSDLNANPASLKNPVEVAKQRAKQEVAKAPAHELLGKVEASKAKVKVEKKIPIPTTKSAKDVDDLVALEPSKVESLKNDIKEAATEYNASAAETTPSGDIVHFVTSEDESLAVLSLWYTNSTATVSRIANANKLEANAKLAPGDQIVIPSALVKNLNRLPEDAIPALVHKVAAQ